MTQTEDLARTLHDAACPFPWKTATDEHKDAWRQNAMATITERQVDAQTTRPREEGRHG